MGKKKKKHPKHYTAKKSGIRGAKKAAESMLREAVSFQRNGDLRRAEMIYRNIIAQDPANSSAYHLLGLIAHQVRKHDQAESLIEKAIAINPDSAVCYANLGNVMKDKKDYVKAAHCYQKAIEINPRFPEAYNGLGIVLCGKGETEKGITCFRKALSLRPDFAHACNNLGNAHKTLGYNEQAVRYYRKAIQMQPGHAEAHSNLGTVLKNTGKTSAAEKMYKKALELNPACTEALNSLGLLHHERGEIGKAIGCFSEILRIDEKHSGSANNLGNMMKESGRHDEAIAWYRKALAFKPDYHDAQTNILLTMHYSDDYSPLDIFEAHKDWGERFAHDCRCDFFPFTPPKNRPLRIGYMSPDFRRHPVSFFIEPVIAGHNRTDFSVYCYADVKCSDDVTSRMKQISDNWVDIQGLSDKDVEMRIRNDKIDILVDLAGHTGDNRITVFAAKPAPVQVTYLGYPDTTGLRSVDYRITDALADPPGAADGLHTEKLFRLPGCFLCYRPYEYDPPVENMPFGKKGHISYGSFCNLTKITPRVAALWSRILRKNKNSRLVLKSRQLNDPGVRSFYTGLFYENGIAPERIDLYGHCASYRDHLEAYNRVDIALDPFPYNGTTTTCEAMWMGVPVITLCGDRHSARVGKSLLTAVGRQEFIAENHRDYVRKAVQLADNIDFLKNMRFNLRKDMQDSCLCDESTYVRHIEKAYAVMWQRYCELRSENQVA